MLLSKLPTHTVRRIRRFWLQYGVLWFGAALVGLVAVMYARLIDFGFNLFSIMAHYYSWLPLILTPATGALCVWLTNRYFSCSEGSGIPQVIAALAEHSKATSQRVPILLSIRILFGKIIISFVAILGGFTIGREGPTVQVSAALMYYMRRFYPRTNILLEKRLILAGAAAGLSAAFNTPLAGLIFAIEELSRSFEQRTSGFILTIIIFAGIVALAINGNYTYFGTIDIIPVDAKEMLLSVFVVSIITGIAGGIFCWILLNTRRWMPKRLHRLRMKKPIIFGIICGFVVAIIGIYSGGAAFGSGYAQAEGLLEGHQQLSASYPVLKMASTIGSYLPGIPGGIFAPSLSIGAGFGNLVHMVFKNMSLNILIALAMVGYLAAVTQSPITSFVIVVEMINGHELVIALMATALIASWVSGYFAPPLYEALSERYRKAMIMKRLTLPPLPRKRLSKPIKWKQLSLKKLTIKNSIGKIKKITRISNTTSIKKIEEKKTEEKK